MNIYVYIVKKYYKNVKLREIKQFIHLLLLETIFSGTGYRLDPQS